MIKNRDQKENAFDKYESIESDNIFFDGFSLPNHHVGIKPLEGILIEKDEVSGKSTRKNSYYINRDDNEKRELKNIKKYKKRRERRSNIDRKMKFLLNKVKQAKKNKKKLINLKF